MPPPLNIIIVEDRDGRTHAALSLAVSAAALDRTVRMFFQGEAVAALSATKGWADSDRLCAAGAPTVPDLFAQAREMEIEIVACETGLHLMDLGAAALVPGCVTMGTIGFLAGSEAGTDLVTI